MIIKKTGNGLEIITNDERKAFYNEKAYSLQAGENGLKYAVLSTVTDFILNVSEGNSKTGNAINFNLPVELTCNHCCECYKEKVCYAEGGCYTFPDNQAKYSENLAYFKNHTSDEFITALQLAIDIIDYKLFRFFTCGDIPNTRFFECMVTLAKNNPGIKFWSYTKKYDIVNKYIAEHGNSITAALPENLVIIFSHWLNSDGTYFPMNNPYNLPVSEFIPFGQEEKAKTVTHICPCSDPTVKATCETCDHACYTLKPGESMALLEHSTSATKQRDKEIKAAKAKLK